MVRGEREESVSPRRRWRDGQRSVSISPVRRIHQPMQVSPTRRREKAEERREADLKLLNVTGDSLMTRGRMQLKTATSRGTTGNRSRTTTRASSRRTTASPTRSRRGRTLSTADRERRDAIDRENRILLRKILEQHHGLRRGPKSIPSAASCRSYSPRRSRSSRQINDEKRRHKTDYENLLLLQKIQNVRPSDQIATSFRDMRLAY